MNKTFFIRFLDDGRILVRNNDKNETKIFNDTWQLRNYFDNYIEENKNESKN